ncbi:MAG: VCBS repeat-containing protein [Myxococcota bacterium]
MFTSERNPLPNDFTPLGQELNAPFKLLVDFDRDGLVDIVDGSQALLSDTTGAGEDTLAFLPTLTGDFTAASLIQPDPATELLYYSLVGPGENVSDPRLRSQQLFNVELDGAAAIPQQILDGFLPYEFVLCDIDGVGDVELFARRFDLGSGSSELGGFEFVNNEPSNLLVFTIEREPVGLSCGDLDETGKADLVFGLSEPPRLSVFSVPDGSTYPVVVPRTVNLPEVNGSSDSVDDLVISDLDRDGHLDVAVTIAGRGLVLYGDGSLDFPDRFRLGAMGADLEAQFLEVVDLNQNGFPDLLLLGANGISVVLDDVLVARSDAGTLGGLPSLNAVRVETQGGDFELRSVGDINGDGQPDVVSSGVGTTPASRLASVTRPIAMQTSILDLATSFDGIGPAVLGATLDAEEARVSTLKVTPFSIDAGQRAWELDHEVHSGGLLNAARGRQLTPALHFAGDVYVSQLASGRLRFAPRPELTGVRLVSEFDANADISAGRGFIVEIDLPESERGVSGSSLAVLQRVPDWARAADEPDDALFGDAAGQELLPRVIGADGAARNVVERRDFWRRLPAVSSLGEAAGPRFVVLEDVAGVRVRIVTERLGVFVVYRDSET